MSSYKYTNLILVHCKLSFDRFVGQIVSFSSGKKSCQLILPQEIYFTVY
jgi:hypothetical protein